MRKTLFILLVAVCGSVFADEAAKSKEEMKANLDKYVKENQEASTSIAPLIQKVREILAGEKKAEEAPKKK